MVENCFFVLPFRFQRRRFFLELAQFLLELLEALFASRIFFFFQRLTFHLVLHDLALDHINLRRHGIELDFQSRGRFIDQIDRFVRQITIADIAMRKDRGRNQGGVLNAHTMMHFVTFLQSTQDCDRVFYARFSHHYRLKTPFQCRILFDIFAIFIEGGGPDRAQLVNEENDLAL